MANPFLTYRNRLDSYQLALDGGLSDEWFVDTVSTLDDAIVSVEGHGFVETPLADGAALATAAGLDVDLVIKAEPHNVGGSHKARHLMGVALHLLVREKLGAARAETLAIASCGNAAMGAGVIARALNRPLSVFVPTWADESVVARLTGLGANINRCERREHEAGDPAYLRFAESVQAGAVAFGVQSTDTPTTFDGGRTLGWELADQIAALPGGAIDAMYIQIGGGALATSVSLAMPKVRLHPVQAEGCAPLARAWNLLDPEGSPTISQLDEAATHPADFMWPWDNPQSFATGILDDITYDWVPLLRQTIATGGHPIVAPEPTIVAAYDLAHAHTDIDVCSTGAAGFAGLLAEPPATRERIAVLFTGIDRSEGTR